MKSFKPVPKEIYKEVVRNTTLSSIDLLVHDGQKLLLGRRNNAPAKGYYFVPGSVLYPGEPIPEAFKRTCEKELGQSFSIEKGLFVGILQEHFDDNFTGDPTFGTHYLALCYAIKVDFTKFTAIPDSQHNTFAIMSYDEVMTNPEVHPYNRIHVQTLRTFAKTEMFSPHDIQKLVQGTAD